MIKNRKPRISNIPLVLSLFMILIFGVPTTLVISLYEYRAMTQGLKGFENEYLDKLKERLRRDMDVAVDILDYRRKEAAAQLKTKVHEVVNNTHNLMALVQTTLEKKMPDKSLRSLIGQWLDGATFFQGRGYVFVFAKDGTDPFQTRSLTREQGRGGDFSRTHDREVAGRIQDAVRENEAGFIQYAWPLPDRPDTLVDKIAYVRRFRPFDWIVGVGDYPEAFEHRVKSEMIQTFRFFNKGGDAKGFILDSEGHLLTGGEGQMGRHGAEKKTGLVKALETVRAEARINQDAYAFVHEKGVRDNEIAPVPFLVYGRHYAPWGWTVGTVVDLAPFHGFSRQKLGELRAKMLNKYLFLSGVMVAAMGVAFLIGKLFARRLRKNLSAFEQFLNKAGHSPEQIDLDRLPFDELHALGGYANAMVRERVENEKTIRAVNEALGQANERLEQMANQDGLTGVANRRFFDDALAREWSRAARDGRPLTLAMVDIDKFKAFNDTYGHQAGDACLKQVAGAMAGQIKRPADLLARYGGEEFVVLFPETDLGGGKKVAEDMRQAVALLEIPHEAGPAGRVSFSLGLAAMVPEPGTGPDPLVARADQALYRAKAKGRDRIETSVEGL